MEESKEIVVVEDVETEKRRLQLEHAEKFADGLKKRTDREWDVAMTLFLHAPAGELVPYNENNIGGVTEEEYESFAHWFGRGIGKGLGMDKLTAQGESVAVTVKFFTGYCFHKIGKFYDDLHNPLAVWEGQNIVAGTQFVLVLAVVVVFGQVFSYLNEIVTFSSTIATLVKFIAKFLSGSFHLATVIFQGVLNLINDGIRNGKKVKRLEKRVAELEKILEDREKRLKDAEKVAENARKIFNDWTRLRQMFKKKSDDNI